MKKKYPRPYETELARFWESVDFARGVLLHTQAVLASAGYHDWWSVDLFGDTWELVHRPNVTYRAKGCCVPLYMISEAELQQLKEEIGSEDLETLAEVLQKHPEMLSDVKRLMKEQLPG